MMNKSKYNLIIQRKKSLVERGELEVIILNTRMKLSLNCPWQERKGKEKV